MATSLEDIVNVDMLGLNPEDNSSPDSTFLTMPPTPPPMGDAADLFKFYFDQHMSELAKQQPVPFSFGSPMFAQVPPVIAQPDPNFFIDPALMMAPLKPAPAPKPLAAIKSASSVAADDEDDEDIEEDDDDIEQFLARPIKVAGRGKAIGRKGTVAAGGIKKFGGQAVKDSDDPEDWRPTVEEYKKMTPKEKRQLRNKISARNFRVRRKEYITTLEGDVAERDNLIELIREELGATKLENEALKREVDALKRAMLEGRVELDLPPPGPLSPATNTAANTPAKRSTRSAKAAPMLKANTRKDVARSGSTFWGGVAGAGGVAQVHTTLVPDFEFDELQENMNPALNNLATADAKASVCGEPDLNVGFEQFADANPFNIRSQEQYRMQLWERIAREAGPGALNTALGINAASSVFGRSTVSSPASSVPGLASSPSSSNSTPSPALAPMGFERLHHSPSPPPGVQIGINGLPFATMPHPMSPLSGLAANARPMYLDQAASRDSTDRTAPKPSLAELLTGKKTGESSSSVLKVPVPKAIEATPEQSALAVAASHTLLSKLRDAFWDAFSLGSPTAESKKKDWDPEKVRRVLDGSAVVRVVDVEPEQQAKAESVATITDPAAALEESMRTLSLRNGASASAVASVQMQTGHDVKKDVPTSSGVDALTGVFSNLRLARTAARS